MLNRIDSKITVKECIQHRTLKLRFKVQKLRAYVVI